MIFHDKKLFPFEENQSSGCKKHSLKIDSSKMSLFFMGFTLNITVLYCSVEEGGGTETISIFFIWHRLRKGDHLGPNGYLLFR